MRLPVIRSVAEFMEERDPAVVENAVEVLEHLSAARGLKPGELDVVGELISNLLGSLEVRRLRQEGMSEKDALNTFMRRVLGSIDPNPN